MNKITLALSCLSLAAGLRAGEQTLQVTPQSLADWTVSGADRLAVSQSAALTLPAGAQFSRSFAVDQVAVNFSAQPVFGVAGEDLVTLEVGPAALVFARNGADGQLVLVVGDSTVAPLPFPVKLNIDGSSLGPVDVQLAYQRTTGDVAVTGLGQTLHFSAEAGTKPIEVVISAGAHDAVTLQNLTLQLATPDNVPASARTAADGPADAGNGTGNSGMAGRKAQLITLVNIGGGPPPPAATSLTTPATPSRSSTLEVYTPSAVRHGRVDAIRAAVVQGKKS